MLLLLLLLLLYVLALKLTSIACREKVFVCLDILKIVSFVFFYSPEMFGLCQLIALKVCTSGKM